MNPRLETAKRLHARFLTLLAALLNTYSVWDEYNTNAPAELRHVRRCLGWDSDSVSRAEYNTHQSQLVRDLCPKNWWSNKRWVDDVFDEHGIRIAAKNG